MRLKQTVIVLEVPSGTIHPKRGQKLREAPSVLCICYICDKEGVK